MKRLLWLVLLLSLGLNVGLGMRVLRGDDAAERTEWRDGPRRDGPDGPGRRGGRGGPDGPGGPEGPGGRDRRGPGLERFRDLDLSQDQRDALQALWNSNWTVMNENRERLDAIREAMRELFAQPELDRGRVTEARRHHGRLQAELDSLVTEQLLREMEILTPEQRRDYLESMPWRKPDRGPR